MSRFYDALKQASDDDLQTTATGKPADQFKSYGTSEYSVASYGESNGPATAVIGAVQSLTEDPWEISQERQPHERAKNPLDRAAATLPNVAVDRDARVLPNVENPVVVECYRRLRTKIMQQHATKEFRTLLVTSASPQEGKTVTVLNLALSFAMLPSFKVLLIDGDMRRGTLGKWLGAGDRPGLSNLLERSTTIDEVMFQCDGVPINFIGKGTSTKPPAELLHSPDLSSYFHKVAGQFDLVLVDSPPITLLTDTQLLAANCDAILLVTRAFATSRNVLERAAQDILPFRVIGTVLNGGRRARAYRGYNGYFHAK